MVPGVKRSITSKRGDMHGCRPLSPGFDAHGFGMVPEGILGFRTRRAIIVAPVSRADRRRGILEPPPPSWVPQWAGTGRWDGRSFTTLVHGSRFSTCHPIAGKRPSLMVQML